MSTSKVIPINKGTIQASETAIKNKKILGAVQKFTTQRIKALLSAVLDKVDDALFELADKAETDSVQNLYFDSMRKVRIKRKSIEAAYVNDLVQSFEKIRSATKPDSETDLGEMSQEFSLVEDDGLEERLAIESMANKCRAENKAELKLLKQRLDVLVDKPIDENSHPLDPVFLSEQFATSTNDLDFDIKTRLVVFKLFDKFVLSDLASVYQDLNDHLVQAGVLPDLVVEGSKPRKASDKNKHVVGSNQTGSGAGSGAKVNEDELFSALHEILAQRKGQGDDDGDTYGEWTGRGYRPASATVDATDVLQALSVIQHKRIGQPSSADVDGGNIKAELRDQIKVIVGQAESVGIKRSEDDTIDIIAMLFDFVLDDPNLSNSVKALIARLQIPVLKVAILDKTFFSQKKHPARNLINELAQVGLGVNQESDAAYLKIDEIVSTILNEFHDDPGLFEELLNDLRQFVSSQQEKSKVIEERTKQAAEGKAKVDGARDFVKKCLDDRKAKNKLPTIVTDLLDQAWAKVLFIILLRDGTESEKFKATLAVIDRLIWSLQPKKSLDQRKQLLQSIPGVLHDLREGLTSILYNAAETTKLFKALEQEHIRTIMATDANIKALMPEQAPQGVEPVIPETPDVSEKAEHTLTESVPEPQIETTLPDDDAPAIAVSEELQEYVQQLQEVEIGTWFEFHDDAAEPTRAKLSAKLNGDTRFIFVNRSGFKIADNNIEELAKMLAEKTLVTLDDSLLFDKALESVIGNLRSMKASRT